MFKHILIPTDGSDLARKAVQGGITFAKEIGAKVTVYHAIVGLEPRLYGDAHIIDRSSMKAFQERAMEQSRKSMAEIEDAARAAGVGCQILIDRPASPYQGIVESATASGCDVIFMASHGRGDFASLVLGSVTHKVLAHSKLPVVVFR